MSEAVAKTVSDAIVLSAGFGTRMRPLTDTKPKPLIEVAGKSLLDHALDAVARAGIHKAVVNVHYLADQIERHVAGRSSPSITISDERDQVLETGGGILRALPKLSGETILALNADTFWIDAGKPNTVRLSETWDVDKMDGLLLLAPLSVATGYAGQGDFLLDDDGQLTRRPSSKNAPYAFAGAALYNRALFDDAPEGAFSMNVLFDKALERGRLYGVVMGGIWLHVGTPEAINEAEQAIAAFRPDS